MKDLLKKLLYWLEKVDKKDIPKEYDEMLNFYCICGLIIDLYLYKLISKSERLALMSYIKYYRPHFGKYFIKSVENSGYFFPCGETKIRIDWLKYRIKKTPKYVKVEDYL